MPTTQKSSKKLMVHNNGDVHFAETKAKFERIMVELLPRIQILKINNIAHYLGDEI